MIGLRTDERLQIDDASVHIQTADSSRRIADALNFSRTVMSASPVGILVFGANGSCVEANESAAQAVGATVPQLLSQNFRELNSWRTSGIIDQAERALRTGESSVVETEMVTSFGKHAFLSFRFVPFSYEGQRHLLVLMADLSERLRHEAALRDSENRFRQMADNIGEVIWMLDVAADRLLYVSPAYERIWGRNSQQLLESRDSWKMSILPEDRDRVLQAAKDHQAVGRYDETYRIQRPDGEIRWIRDRAFPIRDETGKVYRIVGRAEDFTEKRLLELQLRQAQKMEAIGTLAGGIAHDFNNILGAILGYAELAKGDYSDAAQLTDSLDEICKATHRAKDLVRQILTFSRRQDQERGPTQIRHVVAEALSLLRAGIPATIAFETTLSPRTPMILADPTQIHQVILNLGANSLHAMKDKPGRLETTLEPFSCNAPMPLSHGQLPPGKYALLTMRDTGHGMDRATLARIFEPFFTTKEVGAGTGLGLAVVHGIVRNHEAFLNVSSEAGAGAAFEIYFPAVEGPTTPLGPNAGAFPNGSGEHILLVDDDAALLMLGKLTLEKRGYVVTAVNNPETALQELLAAGAVFDLVITDLTMPRMTGVELAEKLYAARPEIPFVLTSGNTSILDSSRVANTSIRQVIPKPFTVGALATAVHSALRNAAN